MRTLRISVIALAVFPLLVQATTNGELRLIPRADRSSLHVPSTFVADRLSHLHYAPGAKTQRVSYTVIDSLFNAFSYYGSNQTCVLWEPQTKTFLTIKRGALPPTDPNSNDKSNNIFILLSSDGTSWQRIGPVVVGNASDGYPRYPTLALIRSDATISTLDNSLFDFYCPLTDGSQWVGLIAGYQINSIGSSPSTQILRDYTDQSSGYRYTFGTTFSTASITRTADEAFGFAVSPLSVSDAGAPYSENNNIALIKTDLSPSAIDVFSASVPSSLRADKFLDPGQANSRTNDQISIDVDANNNLYIGIVGVFSDGDSTLRFAVTKSTDNGVSWSEPNILPSSVIRAYATANGGDPATSGFRFSWGWAGDASGNTRVVAAKDFVVTGVDSYSFAAQFVLIQGQTLTGVHYVEVYYNGGQWGIRKIADASLFETSAQMSFNNGDSQGPSQLGCELQLSRTADYSALLFKTLEARIMVWGGDSLLTTDVVVSARSTASNSWEPLRNVTESVMFDRITWIPKQIPNDLSGIPLLTVQAAYRGTSDREYYWDNQFLLASASQSPTQEEVLRYRQYVTYSTFTYENLPEWSPETSVESPSGDKPTVTVAPNPTTSVATVYLSKLDSDAWLDIVNSRGEVTYRVELPAGTTYHTFDTSSLPSGAYRCRIQTTHGMTTVPLSIVR